MRDKTDGHFTPARLAAYRARATDNEYRTVGNTTYVTIGTGAQGAPIEALIDTALLPQVIAVARWRAIVPDDGDTYAIGSRRRLNAEQNTARQGIYLHRYVLECAGNDPAGTHVDHRNGNTLDCRLHNLRPGTVIDNAQNRKHHRRIAQLEAALIRERAGTIETGRMEGRTYDGKGYEDQAIAELKEEGLLP